MTSTSNQSLKAAFSRDSSEAGSGWESAAVKKIVEVVPPESPAVALFQKAQQAGFSVKLLKGMRGAGGVNIPEKKILLNASFSTTELTGVLLHECRHVEQTEKTGGLDLMRQTPRSFLANDCLFEADAVATTASLLWDANKKGQPQGWDDFKGRYPKETDAFLRGHKKGGVKEAYQETLLSWYEGDWQKHYARNYARRLENEINRKAAEQENAFTWDRPVREIAEQLCGKPETEKDEAFIKKIEKQNAPVEHEAWWSMWRFHKWNGGRESLIEDMERGDVLPTFFDLAKSRKSEENSLPFVAKNQRSR